MKESLDPARHEASDVTRRFIWLGASLVTGTVVMLALAILWLFPGSRQDQRLRLPLPDYPKPRLQQDPAADLRRFAQEQQAQLESRATSDQTAGVPIEEAMRQIAEEKIAGWPGQKAEAATPSARRPESEHAASTATPNPPPAAARDRNGIRNRLAGRPGRHRAPSKTGRQPAPRRSTH